jgi:SAM-dependent methyltransferase
VIGRPDLAGIPASNPSGGGPETGAPAVGSGVQLNDAETLALLYDWEHDGLGEDVDLYRALARRSDAPVLELACGSGRIIGPLAEDGFAVTGVDSSEQMLARARWRLRSASVTGQLVRADMTKSLPDGRFGLVILGLDAFGFVHESGAQLGLLRGVAERLAPDGVAVIDVMHPGSLADPPNHVAVLQCSGRVDELHAEVAKWMVRDVSVSDQMAHLTCLYDIAEDGLGLRRLTERFSLRDFSRYEIVLLCQGAGLTVDGVYGGYQLEDLDDGCDRMIFVVRQG